jgi:indolepyruvate ferredoxin oxidoreductase alpha subunit
VLCTIGDSTFTHSGMTPLVGAAKHNADITVFILDNSTVAMTGMQETMAHGEQLIELLRGLGVGDEHLHVLEPLPARHRTNVELITREVNHRGLSVIVAQRECIQAKRKVVTAKKAAAPAAASAE